LIFVFQSGVAFNARRLFVVVIMRMDDPQSVYAERMQSNSGKLII
jgi:hypothetical protein